MATAAAASLAIRALIDELSALGPAQMERIETTRALIDGWIESARLDAMGALGEAGRAPLLQSAAEHLATASVHREIPQVVRAAAYDAALALLASDLVPPSTFRVLYESWDEGTHGGTGLEALQKGEEVLLHLD
jgi:hypothetical protein